MDSDVEIDKFSAFSINYGDHSGIGMFHLFESDWNFKFNHKRLCRCLEVKFFYSSPVFITGIQANENGFFPVRKNLQEKPCFYYMDGVCSVVKKG